MNSCDFVIIGGGIIGLAVAREVKLRNSTANVVLIEKERGVGEHASGRNSGVLHAGFYYAPDSLKARLTRDGNRMLRSFCADHGVPVRACGKVVVATSEDQLSALDDLALRGELNGVDLDIVTEKVLRTLEPLARTTGRAIWSPTTAVADPRALIRSLRQDAERLGVQVVTGTEATGGRPGRIKLESGRGISTGHVINAAGVYADVVARWFGFCDDYVVLPFKGLYRYASWASNGLTRHVYPVPDSRNPFLGVHFTVTVDGQAKIGPTAIPALWKENYQGFENLKVAEVAQLIRQYPRFLRSHAQDARGLIRSELPKYSRRNLVNEAKKLVPSADASSFKLRGRPGIRAQLLHLKSGRLEMDFVLRGDAYSTHVLNAVSPAWTSSLAVASYVCDGLTERGVL